MYSFIADVILLLHLGFITFVIGGEVCVIIGYFKNWLWVRNFIFRIFHTSAIGFVLIQTWFNQICPLTVWENALRNEAGQDTYSGTFVGHWVGQLVFYDAPQWVFITIYTIFGIVVLLSWIYVTPERATRGGRKYK
ncbi:MAG: DUF2784 domain-containing protein [Prosthecochloris sp.]|uniref:DUF2784 domain-containing protein n=1 Tax=Prosthecochloris sp. TaxID=290513 RepID=UPI0013C7F238|nr:DUF2784 domain-containing protein [Prosthecochloris sp.]